MSDYEADPRHGWPEPRSSGALLVPPRPPLAPPATAGLPAPQPWSGLKGCLHAIRRWILGLFRRRSRYDLSLPADPWSRER